MSNSRYIHTTEIHNTTAAEIILPFVFDLISPKSVIDIGCGIGTWLKVCLSSGITDVKGVDGNYVNKEQLVIPESYFSSHDLETPLNSNRKFDLAISLEVAEHLSEETAGVFVDTLTSHSDTILFSAASKGQGGQNHLNEQPPYYWEALFNEKGYQFYDIIRPVFWKDDKIEWWYRQNIFLVSKSDLEFKNTQLLVNNSNQYVHPAAYYDKLNALEYTNHHYERLVKAQESPLTYLKLLVKSIFK